jgi:hypothetical protein
MRDFLLCGMRAFRRLLLGLHQDNGNVVDVFQQWQQWQSSHGIQHSNGDRIAYYVQGDFPADFLQFVRLHYIPNSSQAPLAITTLAECEAALMDGDRESGAIRNSSDQPPGEIEDLISSESRPQLFPGLQIVKVPADYQEIIRRLRRRSSLHDLPHHPVKLAIRKTSLSPPEIRQLSPLSAELLDLCQGTLTVNEIAAEFHERKIEVPGVPSEMACLAGLQILCQQRLIAV